MRIIAGQKRGMKLFSPEGISARPVTDRAKESIFNVLIKYHLPENANVADLFCGPGSFGLEALSRNANHVTFVEKNQQILKTLKRNIQKAGFKKPVTILNIDAFSNGAPLVHGKPPYQLVFVDPPYSKTKNCDSNSPLANLLKNLCTQTAREAIVVVRTKKHSDLLPEYHCLKLIDRKQWSSMTVTILRHS